LNVGPGPDGQLHEAAYTTMQEIGSWMQVNGAAIYGTRAIAPYKDGKVCFTRKKDGSVYAIYLLDQNEQLPATISFSGITPARDARVSLLGAKEKLSWKKTGDAVEIKIPASLQRKPWQYAVAIRIDKVS